MYYTMMLEKNIDFNQWDCIKRHFVLKFNNGIFDENIQNSLVISVLCKQ